MNQLMDKIEDDKAFYSEMQLLRKNEIQMLESETQESFEIQRSDMEIMEERMINFIEEKTANLMEMIKIEGAADDAKIVEYNQLDSTTRYAWIAQAPSPNGGQWGWADGTKFAKWNGGGLGTPAGYTNWVQSPQEPTRNTDKLCARHKGALGWSEGRCTGATSLDRTA